MVPNPDTPWMLSHNLFQRVRGIPQGESYKSVELLPSDAEIEFIRKYFEHMKPAHYGIKKIHVIHNPAHTQAFEAGIKSMDEEIKNPIATPKWEQENCQEERKKAIERWKAFTQEFSPFEIPTPQRRDHYQDVKVVPMWYGTNQDVCKAVCASNFRYYGKHHYFISADPDSKGSPDIGHFGSGVYFTNSAKYAAMFSTEGILLLSWVSMRQPYPVVSDNPDPKKCSDVQKLQGREHYQNYNAHYAPVASLRPDDPDCTEYFPCYKNQTPAWDELVVFEKSQALPRFWVELGVELPAPVTLAPPASSEGDFKEKLAEIQAQKLAFTKYLQEAENHDVEAQYQVGMCYLQGKGTLKLTREGIKWLERAAVRKHLKAMVQLAYCHFKGIGLPENPKEAYGWYKKAADLGSADAQYRIGSFFADGIVVEKDLKKAELYFNQAADQGNAEAKEALQKLSPAASQKAAPAAIAAPSSDEVCKNGLRLASEKKFEEAAKQFKIAAELGHAEAQYQLGVLYFKGQGVIKDEKEAAQWYQKATAHDHPLATYYYGSCLLHGKGVAKNQDEGLKLYFKAADKGVMAAQYYLGVYHAEGKYVTRDLTKAREWLKKAADQGDADAKSLLAKISP
jgi:TPR repeat protein